MIEIRLWLFRKSYLRCLDAIHHRPGFTTCTPVESIYVEANEAPLSLRREKLALQYYTKLQSCPSNPAFECTINPKYKECFARKESAIPTFGIRIQSLLDDSNIENNNVHETIISEVSPWLVGWLVVFNVPSTARSFRDGIPIYCPLRRM